MSQSIHHQVRALIDAADYRPRTKTEFARTLELSPKQRPQLRAALRKLEKEGRIRAGKKGRYEILPAGGHSDGNSQSGKGGSAKARPSAKGKGKGSAIPGTLHFPKSSHHRIAFFVADEADDLARLRLDLDGDSLKLQERDTMTAMHGDKVLVTVTKRGHPGRRPKGKSSSGRGSGRGRNSDRESYTAKVIKITERRHHRIVGSYRRKWKISHALIPDRPQLPDVFDLTEVLPGVNSWRQDRRRLSTTGIRHAAIPAPA